MINFLKLLVISYISMLITALIGGILTRELQSYLYVVVMLSINRFWLMFLSVVAAHYLVKFFLGNEKVIHIFIMYILCIVFLFLLSHMYIKPFSRDWFFIREWRLNNLLYLVYATITFSIYVIAYKNR